MKFGPYEVIEEISYGGNLRWRWQVPSVLHQMRLPTPDDQWTQLMSTPPKGREPLPAQLATFDYSNASPTLRIEETETIWVASTTMEEPEDPSTLEALAELLRRQKE